MPERSLIRKKERDCLFKQDVRKVMYFKGNLEERGQAGLVKGSCHWYVCRERVFSSIPWLSIPDEGNCKHCNKSWICCFSEGNLIRQDWSLSRVVFRCFKKVRLNLRKVKNAVHRKSAYWKHLLSNTCSSKIFLTRNMKAKPEATSFHDYSGFFLLVAWLLTAIRYFKFRNRQRMVGFRKFF